MSEKVLVALPVGLGHVFVACDGDDWDDVRNNIKDSYVVELEDQNGDVIDVDLIDVVGGAIVSSFDEEFATTMFVELDSFGVPVFDALCYANFPDKKVREEAEFYRSILSLIKKYDGQIYDTRAIGLLKSRISFYFRGKKFNVVMSAKDEKPVYYFGLEHEDLTKLSDKYIADIGEQLSKMSDTIHGEEMDEAETIAKSEEIADLAAFDEAFGICSEGICEVPSENK